MPTIVQSGFARGNTSPLTLTLGVAPTSGNILLLIITGWSQSLSVPSGFTSIQSDNGSSHSNEGTWTYWQSATGAGTSYSFTGASDYHNIALFEISGAQTPLITAYGTCSNVGSSPISSGSLTAQPLSALRFLSFEWDTSTANPTTPGGWTLETPSGWIAPTTGNHGGATWAIPATSSGTQSVAFSPTDSYSVVWLDVTVPAAPIPQPQLPASIPLLRYLPLLTAELDPDLDVRHPMALFRQRTAITIQPTSTSHARAVRSYNEYVAANPSPPMAAVRSYNEYVAANPSPPMAAVRAYNEYVAQVLKPTALPPMLRVLRNMPEVSDQEEPLRPFPYGRRVMLAPPPLPPSQTGNQKFLACGLI